MPENLQPATYLEVAPGVIAYTCDFRPHLPGWYGYGYEAGTDHRLTPDLGPYTTQEECQEAIRLAATTTA